MYLLKNQRNAGDPNGYASPGDILVAQDFRKSYLVAQDGSRRRLEGENHLTAVSRVKQEKADMPRRKVEAQVAADVLVEKAIQQAKDEERRREERKHAEAEMRRLRQWRNIIGRGVLLTAPKLLHRFWPFRLLQACRFRAMSLK